MKKSAKAVSFIKGLFCGAQGIELVSQRIQRLLGIPVSVVSGANVANEVAKSKFAEAALGYDSAWLTRDEVLELQQLFSRPSLRITPVGDIAGVEIGGALKNIIALAAGFIDAKDLGSNTKAAILRLGMVEMQRFALEFFEGCKKSTFWESSGFADLITTCYAGRNRKCAEEYARTGNSWEEIEKRMLNGQKLQGPSTCEEVFAFLKARERLAGYPLIAQIFRVAFGENGVKAAPESIVTIFEERGRPLFEYSKA